MSLASRLALCLASYLAAPFAIRIRIGDGSALERTFRVQSMTKDNLGLVVDVQVGSASRCDGMFRVEDVKGLEGCNASTTYTTSPEDKNLSLSEPHYSLSLSDPGSEFCSSQRKEDILPF